MRSETLKIPLLVGCALVSIANAQDRSKVPFSSPDKLFEYVIESVCTIIATDAEGNPASQGSGFILRKSRHLVTNAHVLAGYAHAQVKCGHQYGNITKVTKYKKGIDLVLAETEFIHVKGLELSN